MTIENLKAALRAQPFNAFTINDADGRSFHVDHPEFVAIFPGMERTAVVENPADDDLGIIDLSSVVLLT